MLGPVRRDGQGPHHDSTLMIFMIRRGAAVAPADTIGA
jgi:hypothetical protein